MQARDGGKNRERDRRDKISVLLGEPMNIRTINATSAAAIPASRTTSHSDARTNADWSKVIVSFSPLGATARISGIRLRKAREIDFDNPNLDYRLRLRVFDSVDGRGLGALADDREPALHVDRVETGVALNHHYNQQIDRRENIDVHQGERQHARHQHQQAMTATESGRHSAIRTIHIMAG